MVRMRGGGGGGARGGGGGGGRSPENLTYSQQVAGPGCGRVEERIADNAPFLARVSSVFAELQKASSHNMRPIFCIVQLVLSAQLKSSSGLCGRPSCCASIHTLFELPLRCSWAAPREIEVKLHQGVTSDTSRRVALALAPILRCLTARISAQMEPRARVPDPGRFAHPGPFLQPSVTLCYIISFQHVNRLHYTLVQKTDTPAFTQEGVRQGFRSTAAAASHIISWSSPRIDASKRHLRMPTRGGVSSRPCFSSRGLRPARSGTVEKSLADKCNTLTITSYSKP